MDDTNKSQSGGGVTFHEKRIRTRPAPRRESKLVSWLIAHSGGLISTKKQAHYVLLGVATIAALITLFIMFSGGGSEPVALPPLPQQ